MPFPTSLLDPPKDLTMPPEELTEDQWVALDVVANYFNAPERTLPISQGSFEHEPLSEREMMFLSQETILRFIRASGTAEAARQRLERCLVWRRTARLDDIEHHACDCEEESRMGKSIVQGFAPSGMPVLYFFPNRNHLPPERRQAIHSVYMLERAIDLMTNGVTTVTVIFVFSGGGKRQGPPTTMSLARETLHILSEYYPERLGTAVLYEMPWAVRGFVSCVWPFIDSNTRSKVRICSGGPGSINEKDVPRHTLLRECGGELECPYEHESYWPTLIEVCKARREQYLRQWRALGPPRCGREERLFKTSDITLRMNRPPRSPGLNSVGTPSMTAGSGSSFRSSPSVASFYSSYTSNDLVGHETGSPTVLKSAV